MRNFSKVILIMILCMIGIGFTACSISENKEKSVETLTGTVVEIEEYGHAVLNITLDEFAQAGYTLGDIVMVKCGEYEMDMPYYSGYYSKPGTCMIRGRNTDTNIALCINYGVFSEAADVQQGDTVTISMKEAAGALEIQEINSLDYSATKRSDYDSDEAYANFRPIIMGDIGEGKLYRGASPIDNKYNRAMYADDCVQSAHVATVLNIADSEADVEAFMTREDFDSPYYKNLYESGHVITIKLGANFYSDVFAESLADALVLLAEQEPPYLVHCNEGRDRTGYVAMLLEALMGASLEEIQQDYMMSYYYCFGITESSDPQKYDAILENNIMDFLYGLTGVEDSEALKKADLEKAAERYLLDAGMDVEQIALLKSKLK